MRPIKFRVWDKTINKFISENMKKSVVLRSFQWNAGAGCFSEEVHLKQKQFTFLQYTGLKDKKGVDVFEKDIVNIVDLGENILEYVSVVEYENSGFLVTEPDGTQVPLDCFHNQENAVMPLFEIEVIGSAFENPDLLEGEADE